MAKMKKPKPDFDQVESRNFFKEIDFELFKGWSCNDVNKVADLGVCLKFEKTDTIARRNEPITWLGILLKGRLMLSLGNDSFTYLRAGEIIGSLAALMQKSTLPHIFDITAIEPGAISIFYLADLLNLSKKAPKIAVKFFEMIGKRVLGTVAFQFFNTPMQLCNPLQHTEYSTRRKQEFFMKHPLLASADLERIDIKVLSALFKVVHFENNKMLTRRGSVDNSVFFVIEGKTCTVESKTLSNNIFGVEYFLKPGLLWNHSVCGQSLGTLLWMKYEDIMDVMSKYSSSCIKFIKILTACFSQTLKKAGVLTPNVKVLTDQDFVEIDTEKLVKEPKLGKIAEESDEEVNLNDQFPLYTFPMFEKSNLVVNESTRFETSPENIFPKSRLQKQQIEARAMRRMKKPSNIEEKKEVKRDFKKKSNNEASGEQKQENLHKDIAEIFADISKDLKVQESENIMLAQEIRRLEMENEEILVIIEEEFMDVESKDVQLKKNRVMKDIQRFSENKDINIKIADNFENIIKDQVIVSKAYYLAWKYAKKWREFVQNKTIDAAKHSKAFFIF